jgi:hypothetical protein
MAEEKKELTSLEKDLAVIEQAIAGVKEDGDTETKISPEIQAMMQAVGTLAQQFGELKGAVSQGFGAISQKAADDTADPLSKIVSKYVDDLEEEGDKRLIRKFAGVMQETLQHTQREQKLAGERLYLQKVDQLIQSIDGLDKEDAVTYFSGAVSRNGGNEVPIETLKSKFESMARRSDSSSLPVSDAFRRVASQDGGAEALQNLVSRVREQRSTEPGALAGGAGGEKAVQGGGARPPAVQKMASGQEREVWSRENSSAAIRSRVEELYKTKTS